MTKILWLNRHNPKIEQKRSLEQIFGEIDLVQRVEKIDTDPTIGVSQIIDFIKEEQADEIVCSIPIQHFQELLSKKIYPLRAIMLRTPSNRIDGNGEREYDFKFLRFERVMNVNYEAVTL